MSSFLCEKGRNAKGMAIFQQAACMVWAMQAANAEAFLLATSHHNAHTTDAQQGLACVRTCRL